MKRAWVWVAAVVALLAGFWFWRQAKDGRSRSAAESRVVAVTTGRIEDTVEATGTVGPLNRVEIKPAVSGRIEELLVDEGARVTQGQILGWMSSTDRMAIIDAARAKGPEELKKWSDAYKPTPIIAPLAGTIILRNVVVGQVVDPSVVIYAMSDKLIVEAQVDEADIARVRIGMPARIVLDAYPDKTIDGTVFDRLYEGKNVSNVITYGVKIMPKVTPSFFLSQMTANVSMVVRRKDDALLLPAVAVRETRGGRKEVLVPGPDGTTEKREVETGIASGENVEIVSGLSAGDSVVVSRARYVPQQGPQSSPLTFGGRKGGGGGKK
ncbi:MAG: efflux RND transporter periplasmic adaptor subunit [Elusimicrobia bacterium]|nr:efflux RND transporter periplasmic adaptor subunit [Elusimicrobiota bacterium]